MAEKKEKEITKLLRRQLDILEQYCEIDEENKIATVTLHYEKVSEILVADIGTKENPCFGRPILTRVEQVLSLFPRGYKLNIQFQITDYEGYDPGVLNNSLCNYFELEHYRSQREVKRRWIVAALFAFIGTFLLVLVVLARKSAWHTNNLMDYVFDYFSETCACVFLWESCSQLFLYPEEFLKTNTKLFMLFNSFSFLDADKNVLSNSNKQEVFKNLVFIAGKQRVGNILLIASGSVQAMLGFVGLVNFFVDVSKGQFTKQQIIVYSILACIVAVTQILLGIASIDQFRTKGKLAKAVIPISCVLLALFIGYLATFIIAGQCGYQISPAMIAAFLIGFVNTIVTIVGSALAKTKD